jgi:hypothetical protein
MSIINEWLDTNITTPGIYRGVSHTHPTPTGIWGAPSSIGQSFKGSSVDQVLDSVRFYGRKSGTPNGPIRAVLYTHNNLPYGDTASLPSQVIAYSEPIESANVSSSYTWIEFIFTDRVIIAADTPYFIALEAPPLGYLFGDVNQDGTAEYGMIQPISENSATPVQTHPGIQVQYLNNSWVAAPAGDLAFQVLGATTTTSNIVGVVTLNPNGNGIQNALVKLLTSEGTFIDSIYTNALGQFAFSNLTAKPYVLQANAGLGYTEATQSIDASAGSPPDYTVNLALDVLAPYTIFGQVKFPDGTPVAMLQMSLIPYTPPTTVYTDTNGQYVFTDVPRQNYRLQFATQVQGYYSIDDLITAPTTTDTVQHDITLRPIMPSAIPEPPDGECYHALGVLYTATSHADAIGVRADMTTFLNMVGKQRCFAIESMASGDINTNEFYALRMPGHPNYTTQSFKPILDAGLARTVIVVMNMFQNGTTDCTPLLNAIANGAYDNTWLLPRINQCKNFKDNNGNLYPIIIRLQPEFNQNWGSDRAGNPESFKAAWKHVVQYFRDNGVTNVSWQWSIGWNDAGMLVGTFRDYYPGDDYVDWTGIDAYWMGGSDIMANEISQVYNWLYNDQNGPHSTRPCSLSEWGFKNNVVSQWGSSSDDSASQYISGAFDAFESHTKIKLIRLHWASVDAAGSGFIFQNFDSSKAGYYPGAVAIYTGRIANSRYLELEPDEVTKTITINISIIGNGTTDLAIGTYEIQVGNTITITAIPSAESSFKQWQLDLMTYTDNPLSLLVTEEMNGKTLTAKFSPAPTISLSLPIILGYASGLGYLIWQTSKK